MKDIDFSGFKKISQDDNTATFRHEKLGHELKIAHSKLSPKLKKQLDAVPLHNYADGSPDTVLPYGGMNESDAIAQNPGPQAQVGLNPNNPPSDQAYGPPESLADQPTSDQPDETQDQSQDQTVPAPDQEAGQAESPAQGPGQAPASPQVQAQTANFDQVTADRQKYFDDQNKAWEQDLANGHITPESYHQLFAKKDTLGKIGTLFGLLIGGAGAGLTHQQNPIIGMMNQEINNDLEAQKASKTNAVNYFNMNQHAILNRALVQKTLAESQLTGAQTKGVLAELPLTAAKVKSEQAEPALKQAQTQQAQGAAQLSAAEAQKALTETANTRWALSQAQMKQSSFHSLMDKINKMPEGPQKEQAKQTAVFLYQTWAKDINNARDVAPAADAAASLLYGNQNQGQSSEQQFQNKQRMLPMLGEPGKAMQQYNEQHRIPGIGNTSTTPTNEQNEYINSGITFQKQLERFMSWAQGHSGDLSPSDINTGQTLAKDLQGAYRLATKGGVYKEGEKNFIGSIIDDNPTKFFNEIRVLPKLQAVSQDNLGRINQQLQYIGAPPYKSQASQPQYKMSGGKKYMRGPNGEAILVK